MLKSFREHLTPDNVGLATSATAIPFYNLPFVGYNLPIIGSALLFGVAAFTNDEYYNEVKAHHLGWAYKAGVLELGVGAVFKYAFDANLGMKMMLVGGSTILLDGFIVDCADMIHNHETAVSLREMGNDLYSYLYSFVNLSGDMHSDVDV
jgi:hypothetical protein